jgi:hypothetical protein
MRKTLSFVLICFLILVFFSLLNFSAFSAWSSPNLIFNVTPDTVYINWTYENTNNISIQANSSVTYWFNVTVDNSSRIYFNYTSSQSCIGYYPCIYLLVKNATGVEYLVTSNNMTGGDSSNLTLTLPTTSNLFAGRYRGNIRIYNTSNSTENANITVLVDFPIQIDNYSGMGLFNGTLPANRSSYQSFYFNTSSILSATGAVINLNSSQDVDVFLFDSSSPRRMVAKSINKTANTEKIIYNFLPSSWSMWEIRVYGNYTTDIIYYGSIFFTTLNATDTLDINQQLSTIDFGVMNVNDTAQKNITLRNEGNLTLSGLLESKYLYYVKRFDGSDTRNFTFLVPPSSIASRVKVSLNWTGGANYTLNLFKPDNTLVTSSTNKYIFANTSAAESEEYVESASIANGYWKVGVRNNTNMTSSYSVTVMIYLTDASPWFDSNFSAGRSLNTSGLPNSTYTIQINFTAQNNSMDGIYEGYLQYLDQNDVGIKIPIRVNVTTPMLVVNQSINSSTVRINENINANLTKVLNITMNNTGTYDLSNIVSINSSRLSNSIYYIDFTSIQYPSSLSAGSSATINITMNLSTNTTNNQPGVYRGWIFFNTTGSQYPSHPYDFNLSIEMNLTNLLNVKIVGITTPNNDNVANTTTSPENVTVAMNIFYANGTQITGNSIFSMTGLRNITNVRLYEANASYWIPNSTGPLNKTSVGDPENPAGNYQFNITIPAYQLGGQYEVHVNVTTSDGILYGESSNRTLLINNSGLYMQSSGPLLEMTVGGPDQFFSVDVSNFGPMAASGETIRFSDDGCTYVTITAYDYSYSATLSGDNFTSVSVPAYNVSGCWFRWKIHADSNGTCDDMFIKGGANWFNNITGLGLTIYTNTTTSSPPPSNPQQNVSTTPATYLNITTYPIIVYVVQGRTNTSSVVVKNINTTKTQDISLRVESINSTWVAITPALSAGITPLHNTTFSVVFSVPNNTEVKDYSGKFTAASSYANVSKTFTLRVLPGESKKTEINITFNQYKLNYTTLSQEINKSKAQGMNTTIAEGKLLLLKAKIDDVQGYINRGDYFNANSRLTEVKALIDDVANEISKIKQAKAAAQEEMSWLRWVYIGIGAAVGGVLLYLFWPTKTGIKLPRLPKISKPEKKDFAIKPQEEKKEDVWEKLRDKLKEIKEKT